MQPFSRRSPNRFARSGLPTRGLPKLYIDFGRGGGDGFLLVTALSPTNVDAMPFYKTSEASQKARGRHLSNSAMPSVQRVARVPPKGVTGSHLRFPLVVRKQRWNRRLQVVARLWMPRTVSVQVMSVLSKPVLGVLMSRA